MTRRYSAENKISDEFDGYDEGSMSRVTVDDEIVFSTRSSSSNSGDGDGK